ncbi:MAG: WGR domain-containing protein, partial [Bacteroidetes bacterium]|nr:WGR domain-containing protein [Bacteroidota bacterium]
SVIQGQIKEQLMAMGYEVAGQVGQSGFKCSLAIRRKGGEEDYALGVLIDDEGHYRNDNLIEQYYQRPAILKAFGWKVLPVYGKDWLHQPQKVMEQILKALNDVAPGVSPVGGMNETASPSEQEQLAFKRLVMADRFWESAVDGNKIVTRWGKTGTRGQTQLKTFPDEETARKERDRLEQEQLSKGFVLD